MKNLTKKEKEFISSFITTQSFLDTMYMWFDSNNDKQDEKDFKEAFKINLKDLNKICDSIKNKLTQ